MFTSLNRSLGGAVCFSVSCTINLHPQILAMLKVKCQIHITDVVQGPEIWAVKSFNYNHDNLNLKSGAGLRKID